MTTGFDEKNLEKDDRILNPVRRSRCLLKLEGTRRLICMRVIIRATRNIDPVSTPAEEMRRHPFRDDVDAPLHLQFLERRCDRELAFRGLG
jgi:hypothetical protein